MSAAIRVRVRVVVGLLLAAGFREARAQSPEAWGTSMGYTMIANHEFQGADPFGYQITNLDGATGSWCEGGSSSECLGYAQIEAPDGAILSGLDLWAYDASDEADLHYALIANCDVAGGQINLILESGDLAESDGDYHFSAGYSGPDFDNAQCGYTLRLKFTDGGEPPQGAAIRIRKARVSWIRQVSSAPGTPTFGDVPTNHPFFQFVEALAKSGITGGCNAAPPLFCPDAPLTRGQMAVFLAKALGLQWP
jgi:hypothetical protein